MAEQQLDRPFFEPRIGESFRIAGSTVALQLVECAALKLHSHNVREPFSLTFRGPTTPLLTQQTYPLQNEQTGDLEIFLVPVGRDRDGILYEAVFN